VLERAGIQAPARSQFRSRSLESSSTSTTRYRSTRCSRRNRGRRVAGEPGGIPEHASARSCTSTSAGRVPCHPRPRQVAAAWLLKEARNPAQEGARIPHPAQGTLRFQQHSPHRPRLLPPVGDPCTRCPLSLLPHGATSREAKSRAKRDAPTAHHRRPSSSRTRQAGALHSRASGGKPPVEGLPQEGGLTAVKAPA